MNIKRIEWDFAYHALSGGRAEEHAAMRVQVFSLVKYINNTTPDSREKSLAITKLEEAMFWATAAIARQDRPEDAK